jgi:lysophospholipase L1-like esterase
MGVLLGFIAGLMNASDAMRASAVPLALVFEGLLPGLDQHEDAAPVMPAMGPVPPADAGRLVLGLGDSWLHYYASDVFDVLRYGLKLQATSFAEEGTQLTDSKAWLAQLKRLDAFIEAQLKQQQQPGVVLLSAGGNDVVQDRLQALLKARDPAMTSEEAVARALDETAMGAFVDGAMRQALIEVVRQIDDICHQRLGHAVPIILHGYDYPTPDGRGPFGSPYGNWLQPAFHQRGYTRLEEGRAIMRLLIDRLNAMQLDAVAGLRKAGLDIRHVNLRDTLQWPADWENELHPTPAGFQLVAAKLATEVLKCVPPPRGR